MKKSDQLYELALSLAKGVGTATALKLLEKAGTARAVFEEKPRNLQLIQGIGSKVTDSLQDTEILRRAEQEIRFMEEHRISRVFLTDPDYPERLYHCQDAPINLFYKGTLPHRMRHALSVIGTRSPTQRGRDLTIRWIRELADLFPGLYVVSGLAYGIDIAAHEAALTSGLVTLGVLGHGFHTFYPKDHVRAARQMLEKGALLSDFFSYNIREPKNFIRRNRIIAGLTEATLIVESQLKGGAMATAEMAVGYGRDLMAVPGRPDDPKSAGCNFLISKQLANLVIRSADIPYLLEWSTSQEETETEAEPADEWSGLELTPLQRDMMQLLRSEELNINEMAALLRKHPQNLAGDLLGLEFGGIIRATPGGRFRSEL